MFSNFRMRPFGEFPLSQDDSNMDLAQEGMLLWGGGGAAFSPSQVPNLVQWVAPESGFYQDTGKATPAVAQGDLVRVWADQSGNGNDDASATDPLRVALDIYTHWPLKGIWKNNNSARLKSGAIAAMASDLQTVFVVMLHDQIYVTASTQYLFAESFTSGAGANSSNFPYLRATSTTLDAVSQTSAGVAKVSNTTDITPEFRVLEMDWMADNTLTLLSDGVASTAVTGADAVPVGHILNMDGGIGTDTGTNNWSGHIVEKLVYAGRELTSTEKANIRAYLIAKHKRQFKRKSVAILITTSGANDWIGRASLCDVGGGVWASVYRAAPQHGYDALGRGHIIFSNDEFVTKTAEDTYIGGGAVTGAPFQGDGTNDIDPYIFKAPNGDLLYMGGEKDGGGPTGTSQWRSTAASGGAVFTDEGVVTGAATVFMNQDAIIIGGVAYMAAWERGFHSEIWKGDDSACTTWSKVANITENVDRTDEGSIISLGGNTIAAVLRDTDLTKTYKAISTDLGATWGAKVDITASVGIVHRPRLRVFASEPSRVYLFGRYYISASIGLTGCWYSDDQMATWTPFWCPDLKPFADTGYCDVLRRANGDFYMQSYEGTMTVAALHAMVFALNP